LLADYRNGNGPLSLPVTPPKPASPVDCGEMGRFPGFAGNVSAGTPLVQVVQKSIGQIEHYDMQFSLSRLLLATAAFALMLGLAKLLGFGTIGSVVAAIGIGGVVLFAREQGLPTSDCISGFAPHRVAWATAVLSLALVPAHFFVSCEMSSRLALSAFGLLAITGGLCLVGQRGRSAAPFVLVVIGLLAHMLCTH
jgi:hypothetical protein